MPTNIQTAIDTKIAKSSPSDKINSAEVRQVLTLINEALQKDIAFDVNVPFTRSISNMGSLDCDVDYVFVPIVAGAVPYFSTIVQLVGDGAHAPDFSAFMVTGNSVPYASGVGAINWVVFMYDGVNFLVTNSTETGGGGGGGSSAVDAGDFFDL